MEKTVTHLSWVTAEEGEPEMSECVCKILVEEITQEFRHSEIGPPSVHQQQALQISELADTVVRRQYCLHPFLPWNSGIDYLFTLWNISHLPQ